MDVLVDTDGSRHPVPGGPFNTVRALARLGVPTAFLGRLSKDAYGQRLAAELVASGTSLELASCGPEPTTGANGASGLTRLSRAHVKAPPVNVVDTIGAGDEFGAALLAWLHDHQLLRTDLCLTTSKLEAALAFASLAAS